MIDFVMHLSQDIDFVSAVVGGLLIGVSSTSLLLTLGKISGMSGILGRAVIPCKKSKTFSVWVNEHSTSVSYIMGLLSSGYFYVQMNPEFADVAGIEGKASLVTVLGGLLVGFGTRLGSGCTSGHGVCGLPRLSVRSLTSVCTFMFTGFGGALLGRYLEENSVSIPFLDKLLALLENNGQSGYAPVAVVVVGVFVTFLTLRARSASADTKKTDGDQAVPVRITTHPLHHIVHFVTAFGFGWGLCLSGMTSVKKVRGFLDPSGPAGWDPSLAGVMAGAVVFNLISFRMLRQWQVVPMCLDERTCQSLDKTMKYGTDAENMKINWRLVLGAVIFGIGWGVGGKTSLICLIDQILVWLMLHVVCQVHVRAQLWFYLEQPVRLHKCTSPP